MKSFALCLVVFVVGAYAGEVPLSKAQKEYYLKWSGECLEEHKVANNVAHEIRAGIWTNVNNETNCYTMCLQNKANFMIDLKPNFRVLADILGPLFGQEKADTANKNCNNILGDDECDTSFKLYQCYYTNGITPPIK